MNMDTRLLQERLKQVPGYMALFERAFGPGTEPYGGRICGAIAEYLKTIRTESAPFDRWLNGESTALTDEQKAGMALFQGRRTALYAINGPMLSDGAWHVTGCRRIRRLLGMRFGRSRCCATSRPWACPTGQLPLFPYPSTVNSSGPSFG